MSKRSERKEEHLALAQMFFNKQKQNSFDQMHLLRPTLPESKVDLANIKTTFLGKELAAPFFIEAMTGGSEKSKLINQKLGLAACKANIALALGSASILVNEEEQLDSFVVARKANPDGVIIANVNPLTPAGDAEKIVNELNADALQIHLNVVQEAAMPEGERDFNWLNNMKAIRQKVTVPIIVKEVGFGFDEASLITLKDNGFILFDLGGSGGTNFAEIENKRNQNNVSYLEDLGLSTVTTSLIAKKTGVDFLVSGGVRHPLDVVKALALGGQMVGVANTFLQELMTNDLDGLSKLLADWKDELALLLAIFGKDHLRDLENIKKYYDLPLKNEIDQLV